MPRTASVSDRDGTVVGATGHLYARAVRPSRCARGSGHRCTRAHRMAARSVVGHRTGPIGNRPAASQAAPLHGTTLQSVVNSLLRDLELRHCGVTNVPEVLDANW